MVFYRVCVFYGIPSGHNKSVGHSMVFYRVCVFYGIPSGHNKSVGHVHGVL